MKCMRKLALLQDTFDRVSFFHEIFISTTDGEAILESDECTLTSYTARRGHLGNAITLMYVLNTD